MNKLNFSITDNIEDVLKATDEAIYNALDIIGGKAEDYAIGLAPVKSGWLKQHMAHEVHMDKKEVWIGNTVKYAPSVEFGHHQQVGRYVPAIGKRLVREFVPGKPFLKPAIENHLDEYKKIFAEELKS